MRTVAIICILNALLEYITMTALLEYLDLFTNSSSCEMVQHSVTMGSIALLSTTAKDYIMCGTVMLSSNTFRPLQVIP